MMLRISLTPKYAFLGVSTIYTYLFLKYILAMCNDGKYLFQNEICICIGLVQYTHFVLKNILERCHEATYLFQNEICIYIWELIHINILR